MMYSRRSFIMFMASLTVPIMEGCSTNNIPLAADATEEILTSSLSQVLTLHLGKEFFDMDQERPVFNSIDQVLYSFEKYLGVEKNDTPNQIKERLESRVSLDFEEARIKNFHSWFFSEAEYYAAYCAWSYAKLNQTSKVSLD